MLGNIAFQKNKFRGLWKLVNLSGLLHTPLITRKNNSNTISHVLGNITLEEKSILDKVYKRVIESLEQLNTKKEEYIITELNSFDKDQP